MSTIKRYLNSWWPFVVASDARWAITIALRNRGHALADRACVSLAPGVRTKGHVLLSYIIAPFLHPGHAISHSHSNYWEAFQMAQTFLELGYAVDVISWTNHTFLPDQPYTVMVDTRHNLERLLEHLPGECHKIFHADIANIAFHNAAEARRLWELQQRRGVTLRARRSERANRAIEMADCCTLFGNAFTQDTYRYAGKPLYQLPIPSPLTYDWADGKNWDAARRRFMFFASGGLVHKGLDLVLEAFARHSEYELLVCGPIPRSPRQSGRAPNHYFAAYEQFLEGTDYLEQDFCGVYARELYELPNIRVMGWVDSASPQFQQITAACAAVIGASCSEGGSVALPTCMHAGLIPIASYESGIDVEDFGNLLKPCTVDTIESAVGEVADMPVPLLQERARRAWEYARQHHTRERYASEYMRLMRTLLAAPDVAPTAHEPPAGLSVGRSIFASFV